MARALPDAVGPPEGARLADVAWTWLVEALEKHHAQYTAAGGTATRVLSESYGTLAEMALARRLGRRVVALAGAPVVDGADVAATPREAVELALRDLP